MNLVIIAFYGNLIGDLDVQVYCREVFPLNRPDSQGFWLLYGDTITIHT